MAVIARHIGFCPVCQGRWKVRSNVLVHHGYKRPGTGEIHGDCFAVGLPPHELSPNAADLYLRQAVVPQVRDTERRLARLEHPGPDTLPFEVWNPHTGQYVSTIRQRHEVSHYEWERRLNSIRHAVSEELAWWRGEAKRLEGLISTWTLLPLLTIEEEERRERESKASQQSRVSSERQQKSDHALINLQQRIDRAVKKKDLYDLVDLFQYGWQKVLEPLGRATTLTREDVLHRVDRDEVWHAIGAIQLGGYISRSEASNIDIRRTDIAWPAPRQVPRSEIDRVKGERAAKKDAKLQKELENAVAQYRKSVDRELVSRSAARMLKFFLSISLPRSLADALKISERRVDMLHRLERDDVWNAFGWIHPDGTYFSEQDFEAVMGPRWKWYDDNEAVDATYPWPRGL